MKILLATCSSGSRGGGELYLLYLGRALAARGHSVTLWASTHSRMDELCANFAAIGAVERSDYRNTYDYRTRSVAAYLNFSAARRAASAWQRIAPDLVHINKQNLEDGLDLLRAARRCGLPHLSTIHLTQSAQYLRARIARLRDAVSRRALREDQGALVCVLEERARDLARFIGESPRIHCVPNGVELFDLTDREAIRSRQRATLGVSPETLLVTAVGRLVPQKRPFVFLEMAERIHARVPHAQFVWVGDGELAAGWDEQVRLRGLGAFVRRLGWQSQVRDFLFAADVFLHTAEFEGLPLAILEALSAGLPCAITPNLVAEMPFLNENNSIAIDDGGGWAEVLQSPETLASLGRNARHLAEEQFSFDLMAQRYERLYEAAIADKAKRP